MDRRERDGRRLIQAAGLELVSLDKCGTGHLRARVRRPADGQTAIFILANTASDHRASHNKAAELRRFAAGTFDPITRRS